MHQCTRAPYPTLRRLCIDYKIIRSLKFVPDKKKKKKCVCRQPKALFIFVKAVVTVVYVVERTA